MFPMHSRFDLRTASPEECKAFIACSSFFECTEQPQGIVETWDYWTYPRVELFATSELNILFVADFENYILYAFDSENCVVGRKLFPTNTDICAYIAQADTYDIEADFGVF